MHNDARVVCDYQDSAEEKLGFRSEDLRVADTRGEISKKIDQRLPGSSVAIFSLLRSRDRRWIGASPSGCVSIEPDSVLRDKRNLKHTLRSDSEFLCR